MEFAIGSAALLLLLLGAITLARFQEVQRRATSAARQVAFESTWRPEGFPRQAAVHRAFSEHLDDDGVLDAVGRARHVATDDLQVGGRIQSVPGLAGNAATLLLTLLQSSEALVGGDIDLEAGGYVTGALVTHLAPHPWLPEPFGDLDLSLRQPFAILSDSWNGAGPQHVRERTASLVPTQRLSSLATMWRELAAPLSVLEPSIDRLCLGLIEPDVIPEDRLSPAVRGRNIRRPCQ